MGLLQNRVQVQDVVAFWQNVIYGLCENLKMQQPLIIYRYIAWYITLNSLYFKNSLTGA